MFRKYVGTVTEVRMRHARLFVAVLLAGLGAPPSIAQELRAIPGSRVAIGVPENFAVSDRFAGFIDATSNASVVVLDVPAVGYEQMAAGLTPDALASRGIMNAKRGPLAGRAEPYVYFTAEQASPIGLILKYLLLARTGEHAALITVNVPRDKVGAGAPDAASVEAMLAKATIRVEAAAVASAYQLAYLGPLRDAGTVGGSSRIYTIDGQGPAASPQPGRVLFLVAPSLSTAPVVDLAATADTMLKQISGTSEIEVTRRSRLTISGHEAIEHVATAKTGNGKVPIRLVQVMLSNPKGGYIRMIGQAPEAEAEKLLPEFQKIARSLVLP
jgi:hypothetical protein